MISFINLFVGKRKKIKCFIHSYVLERYEKKNNSQYFYSISTIIVKNSNSYKAKNEYLYNNK